MLDSRPSNLTSRSGMTYLSNAKPARTGPEFVANLESTMSQGMELVCSRVFKSTRSQEGSRFYMTLMMFVSATRSLCHLVIPDLSSSIPHLIINAGNPNWTTNRKLLRLLSPKSNPPMSSQPLQSPATQLDSSAEIARLKRRLAASQDEVEQLSSRKVKKPLFVNLFRPFSS